MFDWIVLAIGGGLLAAGCATGSMLTKLLQRLLFKRKSKTEAVKEAVNAQDVEASREGQGDGMEDLLFDEKLKLLMMKENLKKKLLKQKQIIRQLMGSAGGDKGQPSEAAAAAAAAPGIGGAGDKGSSGSGSASEEPGKSDRQSRAEAEVEYFASELELSKWQN